MMKWPSFREIFAFRFPTRLSETFFFVETDLHAEENSKLPEDWFGGNFDPSLIQIERSRFDNMIRLWVGALAYGITLALWAGGVITRLLPITLVFAGYGLVEFLCFWVYLRHSFIKKIDYVLSSVDLLAVGLAYLLTGGANTPLTFIFFVPLIVHAFHHDWELILFNGVGGIVAFLGAALVSQWDNLNAVVMTDLMARVMFMLLIVGITATAGRILERKDIEQKQRFQRMRMLTRIAELLNRVNSMGDLTANLTQMVKNVSEMMKSSGSFWCRLMLNNESDGALRSTVWPDNDKMELRHDVPAETCPAFRSNQPFALNNPEKDAACPVERFSFGSHLCMPISGSGSETFGVFFVARAEKNSISREEVEFVRFIAKSIGLTLERMRRVKDLKDSIELNSCVTATFMMSSRGLSATFQSILEGIMTIISADHASLLVWDSAARLLKTKAALGMKAGPEGYLNFDWGDEAPGQALEKGQPVSLSDLRACLKIKNAFPGIRALLCFPLMNMKGEPLGVLTLSRFEKREGFDAGAIMAGQTYSAHAALALENAMIHQKKEDQLSYPKAA
jgi:GAF domain-containing protein